MRDAQNESHVVSTPESEVDGNVKDSSLVEVRSDNGNTGSTAHMQTNYPLPIILAGGLEPNNVAKAISQVRPWAVDVSGGVESVDRQHKDLGKVRAFIACAKGLAESYEI